MTGARLDLPPKIISIWIRKIAGRAAVEGAKFSGGNCDGWIMVSLTPVKGLRADSVVITETADAELLARPLHSQADIEEIERVPLDRRLRIDNFSRRIALALEARNPGETAIHYVPDGDV